MEYLNPDQAGEYLGLSGSRIRQLCRAGCFGQKVSDRWVVTRAELDEYKAQPRRKPGRPRKEGDDNA